MYEQMIGNLYGNGFIGASNTINKQLYSQWTSAISAVPQNSNDSNSDSEKLLLLLED